MPSIAIRCRGLRKRYEDVLAVDGIDLQVVSGECFGLLGPNGAGKTTTVEIFEGLVEADAGEIEVLGQDVSGGDGSVKQRTGVTLQESQFMDKLTVFETLTLFRSFYATGREPDEMLALVGLEEKSRSWVRRLSGGQRQRLSIACGLIGDPELLFLDEPTTGLDPHSRRQIWDVIERFRDNGGTVLLTTHYMEEAQRLCDRVAIIDRGRVIAEDTPQRMIASLGAEHVVEFSAEPLPAVDSLVALAGVRSVREHDGTISLTVAEVHHALPALLEELGRRQATLTRLTTHHASLEDVFVSLTGRHLEQT